MIQTKGFDNTLKWLIVYLLVAATGACSVNNTLIPDWFYNSQDTKYEKLMEQGQLFASERYHKKAMEIFDQAGKVLPERPEWEYEKALAYFHMGRYRKSIEACQNVLDRDPDFYDALSFSWAIRLESENASQAMKNTVRREIEDLINTRGDNIDALMAACEGYQWLKDRPLERKLIMELAEKADSADPETRDIIAQRLFEQIIYTRDDPEAKIGLINAYVFQFPGQRFTAYLAFLLLKTKQEQSGDSFEWEPVAQPLLNKYPDSYQVKTGVAHWLIENSRDPLYAVSLLEQSLVLADKYPEQKPRFFKADLWEEELEKQKDRIRLLLGRGLYDAEKYDAADSVLATVAGKNRHWGDVYYYQAKIALAEGKNKEAMDLFQQALETGERDDDTHDLLCQLLLSEYGYEGDPAAYFANHQDVIRFTDVTVTAGMGNVKAKRAAWGDADNDGYDDLLLDGNRLFKNTGEGSFVDISGGSGLDELKKTTGGVWADYNNDGLLDIFITSRSGNYLLENLGNGIFANRTQNLPEPGLTMKTEAAAWGDMNNDGYLDLYVANYEDWGVMRAIGTPDRLYRNHEGMRFGDVTDQAGIVSDEAMCGRGVIWTDINMDGYQDIVVANYRLDPNFLWMSRNAAFTDEAGVFGVKGTMVDGAFGHSIGPVSGDLDNDGDPDLFITNLAHPRYIQYSDVDMMLMNNGGPDYYFTDRYAESGIFFEETNADPALADIDNDGDLDLYMSSIYPGRYSHLYMNDGEGRFRDISWVSATRVENSWGTAFADYNHDGFVDLLVASVDGVRLFKNKGNENHWVSVRINDDRCNRFGIGTGVTVKYGEKQQVREVFAGRGTGSQDATTLIFGLGDYSGPVEVSAKTLCGDILKAIIDHPDHQVILKN